jgi:hypothetical protein
MGRIVHAQPLNITVIGRDSVAEPHLTVFARLDEDAARPALRDRSFVGQRRIATLVLAFPAGSLKRTHAPSKSPPQRFSLVRYRACDPALYINGQINAVRGGVQWKG